MSTASTRSTCAALIVHSSGGASVFVGYIVGRSVGYTVEALSCHCGVAQILLTTEMPGASWQSRRGIMAEPRGHHGAAVIGVMRARYSFLKTVRACRVMARRRAPAFSTRSLSPPFPVNWTLEALSMQACQ